MSGKARVPPVGKQPCDDPLISLTKRGREAFATIDVRSREQVSAILEHLGAPELRARRFPPAT